MSSRHGVTRAFLMVVFSTLLVVSADATLIWDGDASRGTGVFGNMNCDSPGSVTAVSDSTHGTVWRYYKPAGSNRCENHGIRVNGTRYVFQGGQTYYLGWHSRLTSTVNNNANFQWKSYGSHIQNYPVLLKMISGRITLQYRAPGESCCRTLWSTPISANVWHHYTLGLHLSSSASSGWIEFWFNGVQQTLSNGSTRYPGRTLDDINEPKWGIYGATDTTVINYVDSLKVGTTYADVAPGGGGPTPTPTPTPTPAPTRTPTPTPTPTPPTNPGCVTATAGGGFQNTSFPTQSGSFAAEFDATPSASPMDGVVGLSQGAQTSYAGFAALARFNPSGQIDARNGSVYSAASSIPYSGGVAYHFRLLVNVPAHTYSVFVRPAGGSEMTVGSNFAFRSEQASVASLSNWGVRVNSATGSTTACNFALGVPPGPIYLWFEGENGTLTSPMQVAPDSTASGGQYIQVTPGNNSTGAAPSTGHATFTFDVSTSGTYKVWGRVIAPTNGDDSFWVRMDGGGWTNWNEIPIGASWHWDDVHDATNANAVMTYSLSAGSHTLTVAYREDGTRLDKVLVTDDLAFVPSGTGN